MPSAVMNELYIFDAGLPDRQTLLDAAFPAFELQAWLSVTTWTAR